MGDEFLQGLGADIQRAFADAGVDPSGYHQFEFEFLLSAEDATRRIREALQAMGLTCRTGQLEDGSWLCLASQPLEIDVPALDRLGRELVALVEQHSGEFNGWSLLASAKELTSPDARVMQVGQFDTREIDRARFPHVVVAHVLDAIEPVDRGTKYDDKIAERLAAVGAGHVVAAGSQLNRNGDVVALRFEVHLVDADRALAAFREALVACGAPRGSTLHVEGRSTPLHETGAA